MKNSSGTDDNLRDPGMTIVLERSIAEMRRRTPADARSTGDDSRNSTRADISLCKRDGVELVLAIVGRVIKKAAIDTSRWLDSRGGASRRDV